MRLNPHLSFPGTCEAAFDWYRELLGGEIVTMLKYADSPLADSVAADWRDKILHATLAVDDAMLTGADVRADEYARPRGFSILLHIEGAPSGRAIFEQLSAGGTVRLAFDETFWSAGYGVLVDRFGVPWDLSCS